ncbi:MAG: thioredoxin domain-containing protein [Myxococcales bacterium]|nr:thioredoxin domain-containing protein [Myxococcales bacterium]MCB9733071.1 thioredoxin domain-containing protein [Deltaproteobacteria bacterium]
MSDRTVLGVVGRTIGYSAVVLGFMLSQCVCQNNRPDEPITATSPPPGRPAPDDGVTRDAEGPAKAKIELPASLDTGDLDDDEKRVLGEVLSEQYDPCGTPKSFLESLKGDDVCRLAKDLGAMAVKSVSQGLSKRQVTKVLLEETARRAKKATFDFTGSPFEGDPATAKHVMVKFTDFQCPYCKMASEPARELAKKYDAVLYVKMLPLDAIHKHSHEAARVALAANRQGKFWKVYEHFFENQDTLSAEDGAVRKLAAEAGVDMAQLDKDLADPAVEALVARDLAESDKLQLDGTPTFFVDGYVVDYDNLETVLKAPKRD